MNKPSLNLIQRIGDAIDVCARAGYYWLSLKPDSRDPNSPLKAILGEFTPIVLTVTAEPGYDASLPVSLKVTGIPLGFSVSQNVTSAIFKTAGSVSFLLQVFTPVAYAYGLDSTPQLSSQVPRIDVEISFIGTMTSYSFYVIGDSQK